jgi:RNA polymerase sigma factor (sigma-70 family)
LTLGAPVAASGESANMGHLEIGAVAQQIGTLFEEGSVVGLSDRQLLERFNAGRDTGGEAAFSALVARHGPMVLGVCRHLLDDQHVAEDAFQATFLVLARRARSIRSGDRLCNWLYGVASRTARCARLRLAHRRKNEEIGTMMRAGSKAPAEPTVPPADEAIMAREHAKALHGEIARLPDRFRLPVVLCYLEGLTVREAARQLRWSHGTVRSRMARAREKLRRGLMRRGIVAPAAAVAAVLDSRPASASVSSALFEMTTRAADRFAAGPAAVDALSASTMDLAHEVLRSMLIHKLKLAAVTAFFLGAVATGGLYLSNSLAMNDEPKAPRKTGQPPPAAKSDVPGPGRMFVTGRVLDPHGEPVPNATVMVHARLKMSSRVDQMVSWHSIPIGHGGSDSSGLYRLDAPRTSSARYDTFCAVALAPGYGVGWVQLDLDADQPAADIRLRPEQLIQGRLFDVQGRPARGVSVSVSSVSVVGPRFNPRLPQSPDGVFFPWIRANDFSGWPKPVSTDSDGRFTLRGVGQELLVFLSVNDPRFGLQRIEVESDRTPDPKQLTRTLLPPQTVTGRVTYADTGKPVAHTLLEVGAVKGNQGYPMEFETDGGGRFRVNPSPGDSFHISAFAPEGQPYLTDTKRFEWPKGSVEHSVDLALPPGILIRGKITEQGSGKPVADARVWFNPERWADLPTPLISKSRSGPDGSFRLAVPPAPGYVVIEGPSDEYVLQEIGDRMLTDGKPGGRRFYSHAFIACDPKPGKEAFEINAVLRRGVSVSGQVIGPDGQAVQDVSMVSPVILTRSIVPWRHWRSGDHGVVRNGRFTIHGLAPEVAIPVYFLEPKRQLGATAYLSGKSADGGPVTIRLEPCGTATQRLLDSSGKPIEGNRGLIWLMLVVAPGPLDQRGLAVGDRLSAETELLQVIDPIHYSQVRLSDAQGRLTFPALIPGATYRTSEPSRDFTVKPGENVELGDVRIGKPPS